MSTEQLTDELLALPLRERVVVAEALWESIHEESLLETAEDQRAANELAKRRDAELASGSITARSHEQVIEAARQVLECA